MLESFLKIRPIVKIEKSVEYWGFGFCVELQNVPIVYIPIARRWTPTINYNVLDNYVRSIIINKEEPLTERELRYLHLIAMEKWIDAKDSVHI